eukprot:CAMPEP_0175411062 /NCGR_PEP_ID=MMETSP0095-20121207/41930_1 /TAXON_ID=311494 /ORGANISM="Alexandrium monilatum, Strain CCMP3105" /LENGTH=278 /DNA_ID=CAMNT_0016710031 /DNA_START=9 /DNA_END=842 /DNA_ORIENTATION=-
MHAGGLIKPRDEGRLTTARLRQNLHSPSFLVAWLLPYVVFLLLCLLYAYSFISVPSICIILSVCFAIVGFLFITVRTKGPLFLPLAVGILVSVFTGTLFGLYTYDKYAVFPKFYANAQLYTNVVPSQPAAAVSDAGKIVFTTESYVSSAQSAGFLTESGYTYCAAPVIDNNPAVMIEFWAVGMGCCDDTGRFWCDSAGDKSAHAGITVFDNNGFFDGSNFDVYQKAKEKAEATFKLISAQEPMFIRFVREDNLNMLSDYYNTRASLYLLVFCLLQLFG